MKRLIQLVLGALLLFNSASLFGQGARFDDIALVSQSGGFVSPIILPHPNIQVCTSAASISNGNSCTPAATTFTDITLATPCSSATPVVLQNSSSCTASGDASGNYGFWLAPGTYIYCVTGAGSSGACFKKTIAFSPGDALTGTSLNLNSSGTLSTTAQSGTGSLCLTTNCTLTTPSISSPTISSPTLTGTSLTNAASGNTVTIPTGGCSPQGSSGGITGNNTAQNIFTCNLAANEVATGKGLRIRAAWSVAGANAITYILSLGGGAAFTLNVNQSGAQWMEATLFAQSSSTTTGSILWMNGAAPTPQTLANTALGFSWTSGITISLTFNVSNADTVTPVLFFVEVIQ